MCTRSRGPSEDARASRILARVRAIPEGFVLTYGDIEPRAPCLVGHVLGIAPDDVPWHRAILREQFHESLEILDFGD